jgi:3-hydroxyacyl-[acyl-carrier-protein] dehydratase
MPSNSLAGTPFNPDPTAYLPHRAPFLFIDRITSLTPGAAATGELAVGGGYFPPVLLLEAMAQLGGIAAGQRQGEGGVLAALSGVTLPPSVPPETRLTVFSKVVRNFGALLLIEGEVRERDATLACATLTLALATG